jgi:hypothetical protein
MSKSRRESRTNLRATVSQESHWALRLFALQMKTNIVEAAGKVLDHLSAKDGQVFFDDTVLSPQNEQTDKVA